MRNKTATNIPGGLFILGAALLLFWFLYKPSVKVSIFQTEVGAAGPVRLNFTKAMDKSSVEERIRVTPEIDVWYTWSGNSLLVWPAQPFQSEKYELGLGSGFRAEDGQLIQENATWEFFIREPEVVYLYPVNGAAELWKVNPESGLQTQLTHTGGKVYDYTVSKDGALIVYSVMNAEGGIDLWLMDRNGSSQEELVRCGLDRCNEPAISPGGEWTAYSKSGRGLERLESGSKIWLADLDEKETRLLVDNPDLFGRDARWSPQGDRLAFLDEAGSMVWIYDSRLREITSIQSTGQETGAWAPDGSEMLISSEIVVGIQSFSGLSLVDFEREMIEPLFTQNQSLVDYSAPEYSPAADRVVVGRREQLANGRSSIQVWLVDLASQSLKPITTDHNYSHGSFHWSPAGDQVVYQRYLLGSSQAAPQILIWNRDRGTSKLIVENAAIPRWLP